MPTLSFEVVLSSPEFRTTFIVIKTSRTINNNGVEIDVEAAPVKTSGVVVPGKSSLFRLPDGRRIEAFVDIYTKYRLSPGFKINDVSSQDADIISWRGNRYTVAAVEDYGQFGSGFIKASCDLRPLSPTFSPGNLP